MSHRWLACKTSCGSPCPCNGKCKGCKEKCTTCVKNLRVQCDLCVGRDLCVCGTLFVDCIGAKTDGNCITGPVTTFKDNVIFKGEVFDCNGCPFVCADPENPTCFPGGLAANELCVNRIKPKSPSETEICFDAVLAVDVIKGKTQDAVCIEELAVSVLSPKEGSPDDTICLNGQLSLNTIINKDCAEVCIAAPLKVDTIMPKDNEDGVCIEGGLLVDKITAKSESPACVIIEPALKVGEIKEAECGVGVCITGCESLLLFDIWKPKGGIQNQSPAGDAVCIDAILQIDKIVEKTDGGVCIENIVIKDNTINANSPLLLGNGPTTSAVCIAREEILTTVKGDMRVDGNFHVFGTTTSINTVNLNIKDTFILLNKDHVDSTDPNNPIPSGIVTNCKPVGGGSNTNVMQDGGVGDSFESGAGKIFVGDATQFAKGDLIIVTASTNSTNDGLYEVENTNTSFQNWISINMMPDQDVVPFVQTSLTTQDTVETVPPTHVAKVKVGVLKNMLDETKNRCIWSISCGDNAQDSPTQFLYEDMVTGPDISTPNHIAIWKEDCGDRILDSAIAINGDDLCVPGIVQTDFIEAKTPGFPVCIGATGSPANSELNVDVINDKSGEGVTLEDVLVHDGVVCVPADGKVQVNTIESKTAGQAVCIGATGSPANSELNVDVINEKTTDEGVTIEDVIIRDGIVCVPAGTGEVQTDTIRAKTTSPATPITLDGDVCITQDLQVNTISSKASPDVPLTIDDDLHVTQDVQVDQNVNVAGDVCVESAVLTDTIRAKTTSPATRITMDADVCVTGDLQINTISSKDSPNVPLTIDDDLCVTGEVQTNTLVAKDTEIEVNSTINVNGDVCVNAANAVQTDTIKAKTLSPATPITMMGDVCVTGDLQINTISSKASPDVPLTIDDDLCVNQDLTVKQNVQVNNDVNVDGNVCVEQDILTDTIRAKSSPALITLDGEICITQDLLVNTIMSKASPDVPVTIADSLQVDDMLTVTNDVNVGGNVCVDAGSVVQTDTIQPKTASPETPITLDGNVCVTGDLQINTISSKNSPDVPLTIDDDLCVNKDLLVDVIRPKNNDAVCITGEDRAERTKITVPNSYEPNATQLVPGSPPLAKYWVFYATASQAYYVWYTVDGEGTDPAPAPPTGVCFTGIQVDITTPTSVETIVFKTKAAIDAFSPAIEVSVECDSPNSNMFWITNTQVGSVPDTADGIDPLDTGFVFVTEVQGNFGSELLVEHINDKTGANGVTVEGVNIKNGVVCIPAKAGKLLTNVIEPKEGGVVCVTGILQVDTLEAKSGGAICIAVNDGSPPTSELNVNVINEKTTDAGVTIETVELKDGSVCVPDTVQVNTIEAKTPGQAVCIGVTGSPANSELNVDVVNEKTTDAGVTIETVELKDGIVCVPDTVQVDTIVEKNPDAGVTIETVFVKDGIVCVPAVTGEVQTDILRAKTDGGAICIAVNDGSPPTSELNVNVINEKTDNVGVTIETVIVNDGNVCVPAVTGEVQTDILRAKSGGAICIAVNDGSPPTSALSVNVINEKTDNEGVTIETVLVKDGAVCVPDKIQVNTIEAKEPGQAVCIVATGSPANSELNVDVINDKSGNGVTLEEVVVHNGVVCVPASGKVQVDTIEAKTGGAVCIGATGSPAKSELNVDVVNEKTTDTGVTIETVVVKDGNVCVPALTGEVQTDILRPKTDGGAVCIPETGSPANSELNVNVIKPKSGDRLLVDSSLEVSTTLFTNTITANTGFVCISLSDDEGGESGLQVDTIIPKEECLTLGEFGSPGSTIALPGTVDIEVPTFKFLVRDDADGKVKTTTMDAGMLEDLCLTGKLQTNLIEPKPGSPPSAITMDGAVCIEETLQVNTITSKAASPNVPVVVDDDLCVTGELQVNSIASKSLKGEVQINDMLLVNGDITATDNVCVGDTLQTNLIEPKPGSPPSAITMDGTVCIEETLQVNTITSKAASPNVPVVVDDDLCVNNDLIVDVIKPKDAAITMDGAVCVTGELQVDSIASKSTDEVCVNDILRVDVIKSKTETSPATPLTLDGPVCFTDDVQLNSITVKDASPGVININGDVQINSMLLVNGDITATDNVCVGNTLQTDVIEAKTPSGPVCIGAVLKVNTILPKDGACVTIGEDASPASGLALPNVDNDESLTQFLVRDPSDNNKIKWRTAPMDASGSPPVQPNGILGCATVEGRVDPCAFDLFISELLSADCPEFDLVTVATTENIESFPLLYVPETSTITVNVVPPQVGAGNPSVYWIFYTSPTQAFYVWYNEFAETDVDPNPTPPAGVTFTGIEVNYTFGLTTTSQLATLTADDINSSGADASASAATTVITLTNGTPQQVPDTADGTVNTTLSPPEFEFATTQQGADNVIDGCVLEALDPDDANESILVKDQTDPTQNGVYDITDASPNGLMLIRRNLPSNSPECFPIVIIQGGLTQASTAWDVSDSPAFPTIGVDPLVYTETSLPTDDQFGIETTVSTCGVITDVVLPNTLFITFITQLTAQTKETTDLVQNLLTERGLLNALYPPTLIGNVATVQTSININSTDHCIQLIPGVIRYNADGLVSKSMAEAAANSPPTDLDFSPSLLAQFTEYYNTVVIPTHPILDNDSVNNNMSFNVSPHVDKDQVARWLLGTELGIADEGAGSASGLFALVFPCAMQVVISQCNA